jgi:hypothetical protein
VLRDGRGERLDDGGIEPAAGAAPRPDRDRLATGAGNAAPENGVLE